MKIRKNYVSNSSSSSYVVNADLTDYGITCVKLHPRQLVQVADTCGGGTTLDPKKDWYITESITDCNYDIWLDARENCLQATEDYVYCDFQTNGEPYEPTYFVEVAPDVWMYLVDASDECVPVTELTSILVERFGPDTKLSLLAEDDGSLIIKKWVVDE